MGWVFAAIAIVVGYRFGRLRELERSMERRFERESAEFVERLRSSKA